MFELAIAPRATTQMRLTDRAEVWYFLGEAELKTKSKAKGKSAAHKPEKLSGKDYEKELERLHVELVKLQRWVQHKGLKVCVVFEGRDTAGKGGAIKAITERVSPRVFRVIALPAPTEREKTQMYVQRYLPYLPSFWQWRLLRLTLGQVPRLLRCRRRSCFIRSAMATARYTS